MIAALLAAGTPSTPARAQIEAPLGPSVTFQGGAQDPTPTNDPTPTFEFSASDPLATFECALDGTPAEPCSSPYTTTLLGDGPHRLEVRATDVLLNPGEWAARDFTVDTSVPEVAFTAAPGPLIRDPRPSFELAAPAGATLECTLDGQAVDCSGGSFTPGADLADGDHRFEARATNTAGTTGPWATRDFTVDTVAPTVSIDSGPEDPTPTGDPTPTFGFSSTDPDAAFQCSIDGSSFASCESPHTAAQLADGTHRFEVRATDPAGNTGTAARRDFTIDSSVPEVTFTAGPDGPTPDPRPSFAFTSAPGATLECRLDGSSVACAGGSFTPAVGLADGPHLLEVRATSSSGISGSWAPRAFAVDTVGPETVLTTVPPSQTTSRTPLTDFMADEAGAVFECSTDGGPFLSCTPPWSPAPLALGPHRIAVRAVDPLGNADGTPATAEFTVADIATLSTPTPVTRFDAGLRMVAEQLALDLDRIARAVRRKEIPALLRDGAVKVRGVDSLMPGKLTVAARAPAARATPALRGSASFDAAGSQTLVLRTTRAGRATMRRHSFVPLLIGARFSTSGVVLSATKEAALVRDWITPQEARRAVAAELRRWRSARIDELVVRAGARCGSGCLAVSAEWLDGSDRWTVHGRARQVNGRVRTRLAEAVRQNR